MEGITIYAWTRLLGQPVVYLFTGVFLGIVINLDILVVLLVLLIVIKFIIPICNLAERFKWGGGQRRP